MKPLKNLVIVDQANAPCNAGYKLQLKCVFKFYTEQIQTPSMLRRVLEKVFKDFCEQFAKGKHPNLFQKFFASGTSSISTLSFHTQS